MAKIENLLSAVDDLNLVIPEFQREYVWSLEQSKELVNSLFLGYPTGSLLVWSTNEPPEIKNNAIRKEQIGWVDVLLDGQQRLTTLYLLIRGEFPPYYIKHDITHDPRHLYFNLLNAEFSYYQKQRMQDSPYWKSVTECFRHNFNAFTIIERLEFDDANEKLKIGETVNNNLNQLRAITQVDYYVQTVPAGINIDKAIDIFDRVNSRGTKLTEAELVLTHIAGKWPHVRRDMKRTILEYEKAGFYFELDFLTRCLIVVLIGSADFEKMNEEQYALQTQGAYQEAWHKLVKILNYLIPILKQNAYISGSRDMNTHNVLIPIIAYLSKNSVRFPHTLKEQFLYWMFLALLWARYSGQTEQRLERDTFLATANDNPIPQLVSEIVDQRGRIEIKASDLEGRGSGHPFHKMLNVLVRANNGTDWANGGPLRDTMGDNNSIQSHHIFPQAFLYRNGYDSDNLIDRSKVNEVANRAFITRDTNYDISDREPAEYLSEVMQQYPNALQQQFISSNPELWKIESYQSFLGDRRQKIADEINAFLDKLKDSVVSTSVEDYLSIITKGENKFVEFKESVFFNSVGVQTDGSFPLAKTLAAFMNSQGGALFIGVKDDGTLLGVDVDFARLKKQDFDGYKQYLNDKLAKYLGKECSQYINAKLEDINGFNVCIVEAGASREPIYVKNGNDVEFYIRTTTSSHPLNLQEANAYIKSHWNE